VRTRTLFLFVFVFLIAWAGFPALRAPAPLPRAAAAGAVREGRAPARRAFEAGRSGAWLPARGVVTRLLKDDTRGDRHQRFVIRLADGLTLLVAHNIDLAPRVPAALGDAVEVFGKYVWNAKGGLLHWTHRDPAGRVPGGWVRRAGVTYR
jgi:hypothetical protein